MTINTFRLTAARGIQLPNLLGLGGLLLHIPGFGYVAGIPTLKPTVVMNYEADWDRQLPDWNAQLHIRVFHQTTHGITADGGGIPPIPDWPRFPPISAVHRRLVSNWRWTAHFRKIGVGVSAIRRKSSDDHFAPGFNVTTVMIDYEHTNPVHVVKANLGWAQGPWEIDGYLRYQSRTGSIQGGSAFFPVGTLVRIPDYVTADARIAYRITERLTLALSGQNLLDLPQMQTSAAEVERRVYVTASANF